MQRLSGLDASFLYFETPTNHLQVSSIMVFDPSTVPGGYSFDHVKATVASRLHLVPQFRRRLMPVPFNLHHPVGSRILTSTWISTCAESLPPLQEVHTNWPTSPGTSPAASSTEPSRCGRSGWWRGCRTDTSPPCPRCTTALSTVSLAPTSWSTCWTWPLTRPRPHHLRLSGSPSTSLQTSSSLAMR